MPPDCTRSTQLPDSPDLPDLEDFLHQQDVHPPSIQLPLLVINADACEAGARVEGEPGFVVRQRREHHLVVAERTCQIDEAREQRRAHTLAAPAALDVDREVDDMRVRVAGIELIEAGPADHLTVRLADDPRMPHAALGEPLTPLAGRPESALARGDTSGDPLVVNCRDRVRGAERSWPHVLR